MMVGLMQKPRSNADAYLAPPESVEHSPAWMARAIEWARARRATDLHFFPSEREAELWARIDGDLRAAARYPLSFHQRMMARLKALGRCADYGGELLQEGRFALDGGAGEARFSIIPTLRGEKAVVRLLSGGDRLRGLPELGFTEALIANLREAMDRPQGLVLAVGPSGCGKSTALYALLNDLSGRVGRPLSFVTIEDPVERSLPFAAQITADPGRGLGFAECLRAILRQDPEVIMIGEIRDAETATAALQAALTGHRLLSSMHTLSAAEALVRLRQMGAPTYVISSALAGILNLRLARLNCPECGGAGRGGAGGAADAAEGAAGACGACLGSGRLGRTAVGEWLAPTPETAAALQANLSTAEIAPTLLARAAAGPALAAMIAEGRIAEAEAAGLIGMATLETTTEGAR